MSAGQTIAGGCASVTVTVKLQVAVLPEASVTWKVLVVMPTGNNAPLARPLVWTVVAPEQLSVPTGTMKFTIAPQASGSVSWEMSSGQTMVGAWLSTTVTVKLQAL